jgi:hypothetical protein
MLIYLNLGVCWVRTATDSTSFVIGLWPATIDLDRRTYSQFPVAVKPFEGPQDRRIIHEGIF